MKWLKKFFLWTFAAVLALGYAFSAMEMTPRLEHDFVYLQENMNRTFAEYRTLCLWSCLYPWELPRARTTYIQLATRDLAFAPKNAPARQEGTKKYYDDDDFLGEVVTENDWPVKTGERFREMWLLRRLIPQIEGAENCETIDARTESAKNIKKRLENYKKRYGAWHLWCVGPKDYVITPGVTRTADFYLDAFMDEGIFETAAAAGIVSPSRLFASYTLFFSALQARIMGATRRLEKSSAKSTVGWMNSIGPGSTSIARPIMFNSSSVLPTWALAIITICHIPGWVKASMISR